MNRTTAARWVGLASALVAACGRTVGGTASPDDAAVRDAEAVKVDAGGAKDGTTPLHDASVDAPGYSGCMSETGQLDPSLQTCQADPDCVAQQEQTDCCGTTLEVGVNAASVSSFAACEAAWVAHFPGCGCLASSTTTETGATLPPGTSPGVHCVLSGPGKGVCQTFVPVPIQDASLVFTCPDGGPADAACVCDYTGSPPSGACSIEGGIQCGHGCEPQCFCTGGEWSCVTPPCK